MKIKTLFAFGLWTLGLWTLAVGAATPTVTVTLSHFTADHSGAGYVVRLGPVTGGIARRELTDSDGVASFTAVTPAIYSLSIEGAGVPTLQIRVPDTASTTAASTIVISAWTPPSTGTTPSGIWENAAGTIKPTANGQDRNTLQFTSGAADDAGNELLVIDSESDLSPSGGKFAAFRNQGTNIVTIDMESTIQVTGPNWSDVYLTRPSSGIFADLFIDDTDIIFNAGQSGSPDIFNLHPTVATSGSSIAYKFNTSNQLTNGDNIVSFQNTNAVRFAVDHAGAVTAASSVTATGDVTGANIISAAGYAAVGSTNRWKTGIVTTGATVALNLTNYVNITINGVTYKLGLVQ